MNTELSPAETADAVETPDAADTKAPTVCRFWVIIAGVLFVIGIGYFVLMAVISGNCFFDWLDGKRMPDEPEYLDIYTAVATLLMGLLMGGYFFVLGWLWLRKKWAFGLIGILIVPGLHVFLMYVFIVVYYLVFGPLPVK